MGEFSSKKINEIGDLYENILNESDYESLGRQTRRDVRRGLEAARDWSNKNISPAIDAATSFARGLGLKGSFVMGPGSSIPIEKPKPESEKPKPESEKPKPESEKPQPAFTKQSPPPSLPDIGKIAGEYLAPPRGSSRAADPVVRAGGGYGFFGPTKPAAAKQKPTKTTSKLYEDSVTEDAPLTVSGGRTGTGVGKDFKARPWTQAEVEKYKKIRGASQIAKDKAAQAQVRKNALRQAQIDAERQRLKDVGNPPDDKSAPPASRPRREPPTAKPEPTPKPPAPAQTGDRTKDLTTWAKANKPMIQKVGTSQQRAVLSAAEKGTAMPAPRPISKDIEDLKGMQKASQERQAAQSGPMYSSPDVKSKMSLRTQRMLGLTNDSYDLDAYDLVLEYLLSQGHVDTLDEAHYVMMQMDSKFIQSIIEQSNTLVTPEQRRADEIKYGMRRTTPVPPSKPAGTKTGPKSPRMPL